MPLGSWHDTILFVSALASIAGLALLLTDTTQETEADAADHMLFMMTFSYWLVFCAAFVAQKLVHPEWETALVGIKFTGVLAYLLTATCILSLPLHRVSARQPE